MELAKIKSFRQEVYNRLGAAHDATFELTDAILLTRNAYSLADLSLSPVFRRKWSSIYEAVIGTPASAPKPRGKSSGWPQGTPRASRPRYPIVKKGSNKGKKRRKKSA